MVSEESVRQELLQELEKQKHKVEEGDAFGYLLGNVKIQTLAHILELDRISV